MNNAGQKTITPTVVATALKGQGGRPKGSKNKTTAALSQAIVSTAPQTPLAVILDVMTYYHKQWKRLEDGPDKRLAAELTLSAARQAAPYCHARKVIVEEETAPTINVIDRREMGRMLTVNGNGHGGNGSNGHGGNGSNGHGGNGHGGNDHTNGHGSNGGGDASIN
jgi:hypothetical protein